MHVTPHPSIRRLGTPYGGWAFAATPALHDCVVISCGLGEDASFDVEFASEFSAQVLIVDPTPRAMAHFDGLQKRIGQGRGRPYEAGGRQPPEAYDLSRIAPEQLVLIDKAVSDSPGRVRFFAPKIPEHVSYSIVNFQNDYSSSTPFIEVEAVTIRTLVDGIDRTRLQLVKFNIEGSEIPVIKQMIAEGIAPPQLCVEFDELQSPTPKAIADFKDCHAALERANYRVAHVEGVANFLYLQASLW